MFVVISQDEDDEAVWLAARLRERGLDPVELVTATELSVGRWEHRVGNWGSRTVVSLTDGRVLDSDDVGAVVNRLVWLWPADAGASTADVHYAADELRALALSWIASLGDAVLGRPVAPALSAPQRGDVHWLWLAREAGISAAPYRTGEIEALAEPLATRSLLVVDGVPASPGEWRGRDPARLAEAVGLDVFAAAFTETDDLQLVSIDPLPPLSTTGDGAADAIAAALRRRAGGAS